MSTITTPATIADFATLADLVQHLGDVAPSRVRFLPFPSTAKVEDVAQIAAHEKCLCELIDGTLVEKTMGFVESRIAALLIAHVQQFVLPRNLGIVLGPNGTLRMPGDQVRIPDVSFIHWDRIPDRSVLNSAVPELVPNLAVEVLSEGNTKQEMQRKLTDYFSAGVQLVWYIDPRLQEIASYSDEQTCHTLRIDAELDGGIVLPGWRVKVRSIFPE